MILVRDLHLSLGDFALRDVNLELREGGCLALLGPSGAGKTLLLETVIGVRRPKNGRVLLDGRDVTDLPPESRHIAYIPQDLALFPHLSVRENIAFGLRSRAARRNMDDALSRLAAMLDIEHLLDRRQIATLSEGEKQRVTLARALIVRPRVLFLDEPFSALDPATSVDLLRSFRAMRRELGTTVFLVTHRLDEAWRLADDVAIMMAGRIVESGPRDRVLRQPRSVAVARFLNMRNVLPLSLVPPAWLPSAVGRVASPADDRPTHLAIRAEDITVLPWTGHVNQDVRARLEELIPVGSQTIAELTLDGTLRLEAALPHAEAERLERLLAAGLPTGRRDVAVRVAHERMLLLTDGDASVPVRNSVTPAVAEASACARLKRADSPALP